VVVKASLKQAVAAGAVSLALVSSGAAFAAEYTVKMGADDGATVRCCV